MQIKQYFEELEKGIQEVYKVAEKARALNYDPADHVEIPIARNMVERVEGLLSVVAPQLKNSGMTQRIEELEEKYGKLDWRVAMMASLEVAQEKFCKFEDKKRAMEIGIRVGLAYLSNGVVSSPLEGFTELKINKRKDGKEYFCLMFSGPIRSAGTTITCGSIFVADYIRKKMGYFEYDPTEEEIKRAMVEVHFFHERINNLQYLPSEPEIEYMVKYLPVQINGEPSEKLDVPNYKDLDRVGTNRLRNGFSLVIGEALTQKAPKFWGKISPWYKEFEMEQWGFLEGFVAFQKKIKAHEKKETSSEQKLKPDFTYIKDIVAGRPVLTHPLRVGGFRLRYGRSRTSGLSSMSIHPATMILLKDYIAVGTQLRYERPGKSSAMAPCDTIEGPIVKLKDQSVLIVNTEEQAKQIKNNVEEILFLGDFLVNYGEFFNRAHFLVPCGYNEEWWLQEFKKSILNKYKKLDLEKVSQELDLDKLILENLFKRPITKINFKDALNISLKFKIPLHPRYTYHWNDINKLQFLSLLDWFKKSKIVNNEIYLPLTYDINKDLEGIDAKRVLELLGIPHEVILNKNIFIKGENAEAVLFTLNNFDVNLNSENILENLENTCKVKIRDKSGTYIGARMGRPEKAKLRKLIGSPHVLFPVGEEGGKLRSFQASLKNGRVTAEFSTFYCEKCEIDTIYPKCEVCEGKTTKKYYCWDCEESQNQPCRKTKIERNNGKETEKIHKSTPFLKKDLAISHFFEYAVKKLNLKEIPSLIKGVRGTSNADHTPENLVKGVLRAIHNLNVNKDGTIRYDMTEMPITAFRPSEIGTSVEKLKSLGYEKDIYGEEIKGNSQLIEIFPSDVIMPACKESPDEGSDIVFVKIANFIDDLLKHFYGLKPFYNAKTKDDLIGHIIIGLAPHTSAAIAGRIIGFSRTQCCFANPMWHAAQRRDCFSYDTSVPLFYDNQWHNVKLGEFVEYLNPNQVVDSYGTLAKDVNNVSTLAYNTKTNKIDLMPIKWFTKHTTSRLINLILEDGREIKVTTNHKFYVKENGKLKIKKAFEISNNDKLIAPYNINFGEKDIDFLSLEKIYSNADNMMVGSIKSYIMKKLSLLGLTEFCKTFSIKKRSLYNFLSRDNFPIILVNKILKYFSDDFNDLPNQRSLSVKRNFVKLPCKIKLNKDFLEIIGFYLAEGYSRKKLGKNGYYQVDFAINEDDLRENIRRKIFKNLNLLPSKTKEKRITYNSRIFYEIIVEILKCGHNAHTKRIPGLFINLPKNKISSLLRAYFEGDGSVSESDLRVTCDTVSRSLTHDLELIMSRFGIYLHKYNSIKSPGKKVKEFYLRKNKEIPKFESNKLSISSQFVKIYKDNINFISKNKKNKLSRVLASINPIGIKQEYDDLNVYLKVINKKILDNQITYCLNVPGHHNIIANGIVAKQCEGDENCVMLLADALINFSRKYLPAHRGATQDSPLVITSILTPSEVDDMVFDMDVVSEYPLEFYEAAQQYKWPWEIKIEQLKSRLGKDSQYYNFAFTHDTSDFSSGVRCSAYKSIPSMHEKVLGQIELAEIIRAVDAADVARLIVDRHFIRDIRGNMRKFSTQTFRCVNCNEKYRRPPLSGVCSKCQGKLIFTVSEGFILKYLQPTLDLANKFELPPYLKQSLDLTKLRIESMFGKESEKQEELKRWFT